MSASDCLAPCVNASFSKRSSGSKPKLFRHLSFVASVHLDGRGKTDGRTDRHSGYADGQSKYFVGQLTVGETSENKR